MREYILEQARLHPAFEARDLVKMCYQAAYGAEHIIQDAAAAGRYLQREFELTPAADIPLFERVSDEFCRVNIAAWKYRALPQERLLVIFLDSAKPCSGERLESLLEEGVNALSEIWDSGRIAELREYIRRYLESGAGAVHHSDAYRAAEKPAYRLVRTALIAPFEQK